MIIYTTPGNRATIDLILAMVFVLISDDVLCYRTLFNHSTTEVIRSRGVLSKAISLFKKLESVC